MLLPATLAVPLAMSLALRISAGGLESPASAEVCGRCHRAIHESLKASTHSQAMESRLFQDALEMAAADFGPAGRMVCLNCHSPIAARVGDVGLEKKVSWEGVTCDFCHSIREVTFDERNPKAVLNFGAVKTGPLSDAVSKVHETAYSAVHTSSALCATCHEYKNAAGFPVLTTYSEWKASKYWKEGKQCQFCHMSKVEGDVVDPHVQRSTGAKINLHQMRQSPAQYIARGQPVARHRGCRKPDGRPLLPHRLSAAPVGDGAARRFRRRPALHRAAHLRAHRRRPARHRPDARAFRLLEGRQTGVGHAPGARRKALRNISVPNSQGQPDPGESNFLVLLLAAGEHGIAEARDVPDAKSVGAVILFRSGCTRLLELGHFRLGQERSEEHTSELQSLR